MTWNSDGYKLQQVLDSFLRNPSLSLALVQESGNVARQNPGQVIQQNLEFTMADGENAFQCANDGYYEVRQYFNQGTRLYIYFFPAAENVLQKLGLTFVTRQPATEILYFVSLHNHQDCFDRRGSPFINRPIPGLVFGNDIFLNFHAEPSANNEVLIQLRSIKSFMSVYKPNASWMLGGDFNREPSGVQSGLAQNHERLIHPSQNTRRNRIIDYFIYGSADQNIFALMNRPHTATINANLFSDHYAVDFNPAPRRVVG
nr:cytolethal distending toxin subunit B homolog [Drosophila bipectinata]